MRQGDQLINEGYNYIKEFIRDERTTGDIIMKQEMISVLCKKHNKYVRFIDCIIERLEGDHIIKKDELSRDCYIVM